MTYLSKIPAPELDFLKTFCLICDAIFAGVAVFVTAKTPGFLDCGGVACDARFPCAHACNEGARARARVRVYIRALSLSHRYIFHINKYIFDFIIFFCDVVAVAGVAIGK